MSEIIRITRGNSNELWEISYERFSPKHFMSGIMSRNPEACLHELLSQLRAQANAQPPTRCPFCGEASSFEVQPAATVQEFRTTCPQCGTVGVFRPCPPAP